MVVTGDPWLSPDKLNPSFRAVETQPILHLISKAGFFCMPTARDCHPSSLSDTRHCCHTRAERNHFTHIIRDYHWRPFWFITLSRRHRLTQVSCYIPGVVTNLILSSRNPIKPIQGETCHRRNFRFTIFRMEILIFNSGREIFQLVFQLGVGMAKGESWDIGGAGGFNESERFEEEVEIDWVWGRSRNGTVG